MNCVAEKLLKIVRSSHEVAKLAGLGLTNSENRTFYVNHSGTTKLWFLKLSTKTYLLQLHIYFSLRPELSLIVRQNFHIKTEK